MPTTSRASRASSADPYPEPQPASSTRRPRAIRAAKKYRATCSFHKSGSTSPGITRSPVNSAKSLVPHVLVYLTTIRPRAAASTVTLKLDDETPGDRERAGLRVDR